MAFSSHFKAMMSLNSASFEQGLTKAQGKVKKFGKDVFGTFTALLGATALVSFGKSVLDSTTKLGDMSKRLGVSTDFLQKFNFAMEQNGVNSDQAQVGLQRFIRRIGTAREQGGDLKNTLDSMNISLDNANGTAKSGEQLFLEFADGLGQIENPSAKLATAFKFLDSEGVAMLQTIGNGSGNFKALGKEAENLGLVIDGKTITSMQDLDAELKKTQNKFKVLGAKVLPSVLKALNLAVLGWEGIIEAVKTSITGFELFGKSVKKYVQDTLDKAGATFDLFVAQANLALAKLNPFTDEKDVTQAQANLAKVEKAYAETANKTSKSFMDTRDDILAKDQDLANRRQKHINNFKRIQGEVNNLMEGRNSLDVEGNNLNKEQEQVLQRVLQARNDINTKLQMQVERVKALQQGGQKALDQLVERQKTEQAIIDLMQQGKMTREEATAQVTQLLELENQEKQLVEEIKNAEKEREEARKALSENNAIVLQLQEEKKFKQELKDLEEQINNARVAGMMDEANALEQKRIGLIVGQEELANRDNVRNRLQGELADIQAKRDLQNDELQVLALIAQGRTDEANELQRALQAQKDIKAIQDQLKIGEQEAIGQVEQRARLEKQIVMDKLNQNVQDIQDAEVRKLAEKDIHKARNADEKARIRRARKVQALEKDIVALREQGTDQANQMADDLEKKKQGFLEVVLDDQTKEDIKQIENKKLEVEKDFNDQIDALNKRMKEVQKAEMDAHK